jgi:hypothetical protein
VLAIYRHDDHVPDLREKGLKTRDRTDRPMSVCVKVCVDATLGSVVPNL